VDLHEPKCEVGSGWNELDQNESYVMFPVSDFIETQHRVVSNMKHVNTHEQIYVLGTQNAERAC